MRRESSLLADYWVVSGFFSFFFFFSLRGVGRTKNG